MDYVEAHDDIAKIVMIMIIIMIIMNKCNMYNHCNSNM